MMKNDLFIIQNLKVTDSEASADLLINIYHKLFKGHFPGKPIVPGVCMIQIVKKMIEKVTREKTNLLQAKEMKFLAIIDPQKDNEINAIIKHTINENGIISAVATLFKDKTIYFKFKGEFYPKNYIFNN